MIFLPNNDTNIDMIDSCLVIKYTKKIINEFPNCHPIIGKWFSSEDQEGFEYFDDYRATLYVVMNGQEIVVISGTYSIDGNQLTMIGDYRGFLATVVFDYSIENDVLSLKQTNDLVLPGQDGPINLLLNKF